jgi:hypothetical protein
MTYKQFIFSFSATLVYFFIFIALYDGVLFISLYEETAFVWRADQVFSYRMVVTSLIIQALAFVFIFEKFYKGTTIKEGAYLGFALGFLLSSASIGNYGYLPIKIDLGLVWFGSYLLMGIGAGAIISLFYKKQ